MQHLRLTCTYAASVSFVGPGTGSPKRCVFCATAQKALLLLSCGYDRQLDMGFARPLPCAFRCPQRRYTAFWNASIASPILFRPREGGRFPGSPLQGRDLTFPPPSKPLPRHLRCALVCLAFRRRGRAWCSFTGGSSRVFVEPGRWAVSVVCPDRFFCLHGERGWAWPAHYGHSITTKTPGLEDVALAILETHLTRLYPHY